MGTPATNLATLQTTDGKKAINMRPVHDALRELETAHQVKRDANIKYTTLIKAVADKSGITPPALRRFVGARMAEKSEQADKIAEQAHQLDLLFEEIGV